MKWNNSLPSSFNSLKNTQNSFYPTFLFFSFIPFSFHLTSPSPPSNHCPLPTHPPLSPATALPAKATSYRCHPAPPPTANHHCPLPMSAPPPTTFCPSAYQSTTTTTVHYPTPLPAIHPYHHLLTPLASRHRNHHPPLPPKITVKNFDFGFALEHR
ncbi:hypothetical protein E3N88_03952 [Mikania micrantha]|uniref:Uncharacterized protein n=1 Tax=Mikania micrantha TaxID=192012 RepID=A0A5N6PSZ7_9ASTR|nr:hypothetical protein E3N88_03952 [Mikania micrantha]